VTLQSRPLGIDTVEVMYPALTFLGIKRKKAKAQQIWSNQQIRSIILAVVPPAHAQQVYFGRPATVGIDMIFADIATWKHSCLQHAQNTTQVVET